MPRAPARHHRSSPARVAAFGAAVACGLAGVALAATPTSTAADASPVGVMATLSERAADAAASAPAEPTSARAAADPVTSTAAAIDGSTGGYWALADDVVRRLSSRWDPGQRAYRPDTVRLNGELLVVHANAALSGHTGAARDDARARALTLRFCETPPFTLDGTIGNRDEGHHAPGWVHVFSDPTSPMGKVVDAKAVEALTAAWVARDALALPPTTVSLIEQRIAQVAYGAFHRFPRAVGNQINFNAQVYAAQAIVNGDATLLRADYREHLERFPFLNLEPPGPAGEDGLPAAPNLGPGYRYMYAPGSSPRSPRNVDSSEYANIVAAAIAPYERALGAGMTPLSARAMTRLRAWIQHVLAGYWTHSGYLNWDSGYGIGRLHRGQFWSFAQQGLLAIATSRTFLRDPRFAGWAKTIHDAGLRLYARALAATSGVPPSTRLGIADADPQDELLAARMAANAARAVGAGLQRIRAQRPPPLYSFDADIGRVAVSTPRYSTAIVATSQRAFPYGGIELARLLDGRGDVAANLGGSGAAAFGVVVRDQAGRILAQTQRPWEYPAAGRVALVRGPNGPVRFQRPYAARPDAGPFTELAASATVTRGNATTTSRTTFTADAIGLHWIVRPRGEPWRRFQVQLPSWGARTPVTLTRPPPAPRDRPGSAARRRVQLSRTRSEPLGAGATLRVGANGRGYSLEVERAPKGMRARLIVPPPQALNPNPGPTVVLELGAGRRLQPMTLGLRLVPALRRP